MRLILLLIILYVQVAKSNLKCENARGHARYATTQNLYLGDTGQAPKQHMN
jgi:hypothetical protein